MTPSNEIPEYDHFDRSTRRFWSSTVIYPVSQVDDLLLEKSFGLLEYFNHESILKNENHPAIIAWNAAQLIRQAIEERPEQRGAILDRLVSYYHSPNVQVAWSALRALENSDSCRQLANPHLRAVAAASQTTRLRNAEHVTLRGLAFVLLFRMEAKVLGEPDFAVARQEAADLLDYWCKSYREAPTYLQAELAQLRGISGQYSSLSE